MATTQQYVEAIGMSVVFLVIVAILVTIKQLSGVKSGTMINPSFIALGLVPILFYLIATGRLEQFRGAGFEVVLQRQANRALAHVGDEKIEVVQEEVEEKRRIEELQELDQESRPTVLEFEIGREGFYEIPAIDDYLNTLSDSLKYILFTKDDHQFEGYMHLEEFQTLRNNAGTDLIEEIENGDILNQPAMSTAAISRDSSNRAALQEMDRLQVNEIAVLNPNERFVGVVSQDELVRKLLAEAIQEV